jgi:hypothetical protein
MVVRVRFRCKGLGLGARCYMLGDKVGGCSLTLTSVVDLVRPSVRQLLPLEPDARPTHLLSEVLGEV